MEKEMTLGSLFDGIAGFPLAAAQNGIKTIWASEIVGDCIDIVKKHFPEIQHLGDITKINGGEIPPVDIISFGSPCQNLSTAGNQNQDISYTLTAADRHAIAAPEAFRLSSFGGFAEGVGTLRASGGDNGGGQ